MMCVCKSYLLEKSVSANFFVVVVFFGVFFFSSSVDAKEPFNFIFGVFLKTLLTADPK